MSKRKHSTRSNTEQFLVGQPSPDFPEGLLPTFKDVLRDVLWKKSKLGTNLPTKDIVSCLPLNRVNFTSDCHETLGCVTMEMERENYCTMEKIKEKWRQAGFETVDDQYILENIVALSTEFHSKIIKRRNRSSKGAVKEREIFKNKLDKCFNVASKEALKAVQKDKKRTTVDKARDQEFLADQLNERKMMFTVKDKKYETVVMSAQVREQAKLKLIQMEQERAAQVVLLPGLEADSQDDGFGDVESQEVDTAGEESESSGVLKSPVKKRPRLRARKIKGKKITLQVPLDIISKTAVAASRLRLSVGQHCGIVSALIVASGGDLDDFPISASSSKRDRRKSAQDTTNLIKEQFKAVIEEGGKRLIAHYDGKMMEEIGSKLVKKTKKDRLAVLVRSPDLVDKEQLLGIPQLDHSTGLAQQEGVTKLLDDWGASASVIGAVYDTTASNSGNKLGSVTRLERTLKRSLIKMPCRRHIHELHAKHVAFAVSGRETTGPGDVLFKTFSSAWDALRDDIDYSQLCKFDWTKHLNSKMEDKAHSVLIWAKSVLSEKVFPRADYLQLAQLIVVWLGGVVENFSFYKPKKVSSARFVQRAIYYISMELLSYQYELFSEEEIKEIEIMAEFSAIFYGPWFLRSPLTASAPYNDLKAMKEMRDYRAIRGVEATACLVSWDRHLDYLSPALVIFSLASHEVPDKEKQEIADALLAILTTEDIDSFPAGDGNIIVPDSQFSQGDHFWPDKDNLPSLAQFVGKESWLLFHYLGMMNLEDMVWLEKKVEDWESFTSFQTFQKFVRELDSVNDPAERSVKLAQDFLKNNTTIEQDLQHEYIVVAQHRKVVKGNKSGRKDKAALKRMVGI